MKKQFTCIVCPNGCEIEAEVENGQVISVTGHTCPRGEQYVRQELTAPRRTIASSVLVKGGELPVTSVRLTKAISAITLADYTVADALKVFNGEADFAWED